MRGHGLGTALALLGLAHAHRQGASVGMLYVEADNHAGLGLYASLGFEIHLTNRMYGPPSRRRFEEELTGNPRNPAPR